MTETVRLRQRPTRSEPVPEAETFGNVRRQVQQYIDDLVSETSQLGSTDEELDRQLADRFPIMDDLPVEPAQRVRQLLQIHGRKFAKEYALRTLHRLMMRNTPIDHIAKIFDVSTQTIYNWRKELYSLIGDELGRINLNQYIAESTLFYREIKSMALFEINKQGATINQKANMMRVAAYAQSCEDKLMIGFGVKDKKPFQPEETGKEKDQMSDIFEAVQNSINGIFELAPDQQHESRDPISLLR